MADIDQMLEEQRKAIKDWESAPAKTGASENAAERATSAAAAIDYWLKNGGVLPREWAGATNEKGVL